MSWCGLVRRLIPRMFIICQILNCASSLPYGCKETRTSLDCSHTSLTEVPKDIGNHFTQLNLSGNHISVIPVLVFKKMTRLRVLDLSHNRLRRLDKASFAGLENLEVLNLGENEISYNPMNGLEMFELVNLRALDIGGQNAEHGWYPNRTLETLSNLQVLKVNLVNHAAFGEEVGNLLKLREIEFREGRLSHFNKTLFRAFNNNSLKSVRFTSCKPEIIDNNAFEYLRLLEELDISRKSSLTMKMILPSIYSINHPLKRLSLDEINGNHFPFEFTEDVLNKLCHLRIEYLQLRQVTITDFAWNLRKCLPRLRYLSLSKNPFLLNYVALRLNRFFIMWFDFRGLHYLKELDISGYGELESGERIRFEKRMQRLTRTPTRTGVQAEAFFLPRNLESFICRGIFYAHSFTTNVILSPNKLKHVDLSCNRFREFPVTRQIIGANNVEYFNLASNDLREIPTGILQNMTSLRTLILSDNSLADKLAADEYGSLFQNMTSVVEIDLSYNGIYVLHSNTFYHLKNVRKIILRNNRLASLPSLKHSALETLDVSNNFLTSGFEHTENLTVLSFVDMSSNKIQYLSKAFLDSLNRGNVTVLLSGNPFNCSRCGMLVFLHWLADYDDGRKEDKIQDYRKLHCHRKPRLHLSDFRFADLEKECTPTLWIWLSIITMCTLAVFTVCFGVTYHKRWVIRFWLVHATGKKYNRLPTTQYTYDAFLCHSSEDVRCVERMRERLESGEGSRLKLCLYYRDFPLGVPIIECVNEAIVDSRYIILLITKNFIKSQWCIYEFFMAKTKVFCEENLSRLIIVVLEELTNDVLRTAPRTLQSVMRDNVYLEWTDDVQGQEHFWQRLEECLGTEPPVYIT